jgi:hypothetical protein
VAVPFVLHLSIGLTMKIGLHAPSKPAVVVSLLLAILALIGC